MTLMRLALSTTSAKTCDISDLSNSVSSSSNTFQAFTNLFKGHLKSVIPCRFTLHNDEVFRIPSVCRELQVLSGTAWITVDGRDIILNSGEKTSLSSDEEGAVVSSLGHTPLTLQVLSFIG